MKDNIRPEMGDTVRVKGYCGSLNGKLATLLSVDGSYYLVKAGRDNIAEIYRCEFDFVKRTKRGRTLAIKWNIKNAQSLIERYKKNIVSARKELKKYQKMDNV